MVPSLTSSRTGASCPTHAQSGSTGMKSCAATGRPTATRTIGPFSYRHGEAGARRAGLAEPGACHVMCSRHAAPNSGGGTPYIHAMDRAYSAASLARYGARGASMRAQSWRHSSAGPGVANRVRRPDARHSSCAGSVHSCVCSRNSSPASCVASTNRRLAASDACHRLTPGGSAPPPVCACHPVVRACVRSATYQRRLVGVWWAGGISPRKMAASPARRSRPTGLASITVLRQSHPASSSSVARLSPGRTLLRRAKTERRSS